MGDNKDPLDKYVHPLSDRYASREMQSVFSPRRRFGTWRRLWIALAESEAELGIDISEEALAQMRAAASWSTAFATAAASPPAG